MKKNMPRFEFKNLSIKNRVFIIVGLFMVMCLSFLTLNYIQAKIISSVKSYIQGEGLWAKAQKDAVYYLSRFAYTGDFDDFKRYKESLKVPLGDRQARISLQAEQPNYTQAFQGFLTGKNHPEDIPGMIQFFIKFQNFYYMKEAINIWTDADGLINKLEGIGATIKLSIEQKDTKHISILVSELKVLNIKLTAMENAFSNTLSEASRWVVKIITLVNMLVLGFLFLLVILISRRIIKEISKTEKELLMSENRFKSIYQTNMIGMLDWNIEGRVLDANDAFLTMIGYSKSELKSGKINWQTMTPNDKREQDRKVFKQIIKDGYCTPFEKEFIHKSGFRVPVYLGAALLKGEDKNGICFVIDLTEQKQNQSQIQLASTVFDASSDGIKITNSQFITIAVNKAFCLMTGYEQKDLINQESQLINSVLISDSVKQEIRLELEDNKKWSGEIAYERKDGSFFPAKLSINAVYQGNLKLSHYVLIFRDISDQKSNEEKLKKLAHYDPLTGLVNRYLFKNLLINAIYRAKRHQTMLATFFIDLDGFKQVNDTLGHDAGDRLLVEISRRLKNVTRKNDTVARIGGDEFIILIEDLSELEFCTGLAEKIIDKINEPVTFNSNEVQVGVSIGISLYPNDSKDPDQLITLADRAMYKAKASGRNRYIYQ